MKVTLLRHAMTAGNEKKQYIGSTDEDILSPPRCVSEEGGTVYITSLKRTAQTASAMFPNKSQVVVWGLEEMDFGDFEQKNCLDMEHMKSYREWVDGGCIGVCPAGESRGDFMARVKRAVLGAVNASREQSMLFVVHGGVIMAIMHSFYPGSDYYAFRCENCCGYEFDFDENYTVSNVRGVKCI